MKNDGGAAFPTITEGSECGIKYLNYIPGMTLRQWYKSQIMVGLMNTSSVLGINRETAIEAACQIADALIAEDMIAEREK